METKKVPECCPAIAKKQNYLNELIPWAIIPSPVFHWPNAESFAQRISNPFISIAKMLVSSVFFEMPFREGYHW